jgi:secondary thiamine-phosphate synthase enzyme
MHQLTVKTKSRVQFVDITDKVRSVVAQAYVREGVCHVFVPHTTAGITINENADPAVVSDIIRELDKIVPLNDNYSHGEGNSAAHIKASMMGFSTIVPIEAGRIVLGTWQGIYFCEFDGPRTRKVIVTPLSQGSFEV